MGTLFLFDVHLLFKSSALPLAILELELTRRWFREDIKGGDLRFMQEEGYVDIAAFTTVRP